MASLILLFFASLWAGAQNALAGGGSFITLPTLMFAGMDARAANITSTIALFPAQIVTGLAGRAGAEGPPGLSMRALYAISLVGGALGGAILLATPPNFFARLVPWLVLFATVLFAWGSFVGRPPEAGRAHLSPWSAGVAQFLIAIYGGYFGGGIGLLMLAALTTAGLAVRAAGATKNILAGVINASAVALFVFSPDVHWPQAAIAAAGASLGGWTGGRLLLSADEKALRVAATAIGAALTVGLFLKAP